MQTRGARPLRTSDDALLELARAWPRWRVAFVRLDGPSERFLFEQRLILIDLRHWREGAAFAVRHAMVHLDWDHVAQAGPFTDEQCDAADNVAWLHTRE